MIVQCPRCSTRWRVADSSATDNPVFKCGRCHHVFPQFPGAPPGAERGANAKAHGAPPEPDNLEFIFPRRARQDRPADHARDEALIAPLHDIVHDPPAVALAVETHDDASAQQPRNGKTPAARSRASREQTPPPIAATEPYATDAAAGDAPVSGRDDAGPRAGVSERADTPPDSPAHADAPPWDDRSDGDDEWDLEPQASGTSAADLRDAEPSFELGHDDDHDDADVVPAETRVADDARARPRVSRDAPSAPAASSRVLDMEAMMSTSARIPAFRPATRLLLALVAVFVLLALFLRANPGRTQTWLGRLPLIGGRLTAEPALGGRITLTGVQGAYQRLRTGRRIFVISGRAMNNSLVAVDRIEVEGALYAGSGAIDRKVISTGNRTTLKLRELTESEIALLQNLDGRQTVPPGGSVDFAIVFLEPPRDLREFSSRVLTARSGGRAPSPPDRMPNPASVG